MKLLGLVGNPLTHSFSATYFKNKFQKEGITDFDFQLFPLSDIKEINYLIESKPNLIGFSVTIPYKKRIIPYLSEIDEVACKVGAVNSVKVIRKENKIFLKGYNTDIIGFENTIDLLPIDKRSIKALVLGTGGASKSVVYVLGKFKIPYLLVSRTPDENQISYNQIGKNEIETYKLIINTTPLGMFPEVDVCPLLPYDLFTTSHFLIDLTYNPEETLFLKKGKQRGCITTNGMFMLEKQAEASWNIWTEIKYLNKIN
jgi:shikimate dehydrogenase